MLLNSTVNPFYFHYGTNKMRFYPLGIDWMKSEKVVKWKYIFKHHEGRNCI